MDVNFNKTSYKITNSTTHTHQNKTSIGQQPSFKGSQGLTPEQSDALKSQHIASQNINNKKSLPHITEKDINLQVTLCGCENMDGNSRDLYDFRVSMDNIYGYRSYKNFFIPRIIRNGNGDERYKGETTALIIPLAPNTKGKRDGDNAVIAINGNIPNETMIEFANYLIKANILKNDILGINKTHWCYINSVNPKEFFGKTNIRTIIANFFKQKEIEINQSEKKQQITLKETDINIRNFDEQDPNNTRSVKNYQETFIKNGKQLTVGHSIYEENGIKKDMTVILVPTKENADNCVAITIDNRKLTKQEAIDLLNYLVYNNASNSESEIFRTAIVNYLNK